MTAKLNNWWFRIFDLNDHEIEAILNSLGPEIVSTNKRAGHQLRKPADYQGIDYAMVSVYKTLINDEPVSNVMVSFLLIFVIDLRINLI